MINRWTFDNDELFELVRIGRKCGTCGRNCDEEPMAKIGDVQEIYNSRGQTIPGTTDSDKSIIANLAENKTYIHLNGCISNQYLQHKIFLLCLYLFLPKFLGLFRHYHNRQ